MAVSCSARCRPARGWGPARRGAPPVPPLCTSAGGPPKIRDAPLLPSNLAQPALQRRHAVVHLFRERRPPRPLLGGGGRRRRRLHHVTVGAPVLQSVLALAGRS